MRAGTLRHRMVIQKPDDAASGWNTPSLGIERTWSTYATVWARIEPESGSESLDTGTKKNQAQIRHKITIRYIRGLRPSMRGTFEGRILQFKSIMNIEERNRELVIIAIEETDA